MPDPKRPAVAGDEHRISVPEGGFGDSGSADYSEMAKDARRMENRSFPEERADDPTAAEGPAPGV